MSPTPTKTCRPARRCRDDVVVQTGASGGSRRSSSTSTTTTFSKPAATICSTSTATRRSLATCSRPERHIDGIGLQSHFDSNLTAPSRVLELLDQFAAFGKDLQVTEFDISMPDEQVQADYTRDFLTVCFSHPAIKGFLMWGFWEGAHWEPVAAMIRRDWSTKPNYAVWNDLLYNQWWSDFRGTTGADGVFRTRGFLGDYDIEVTVNGQTKIYPLRVDFKHRSRPSSARVRSAAGAIARRGHRECREFPGRSRGARRNRYDLRHGLRSGDLGRGAVYRWSTPTQHRRHARALRRHRRADGLCRRGTGECDRALRRSPAPPRCRWNIRARRARRLR